MDVEQRLTELERRVEALETLAHREAPPKPSGLSFAGFHAHEAVELGVRAVGGAGAEPLARGRRGRERDGELHQLPASGPTAASALGPECRRGVEAVVLSLVADAAVVIPDHERIALLSSSSRLVSEFLAAVIAEDA